MHATRGTLALRAKNDGLIFTQGCPKDTTPAVRPYGGVLTTLEEELDADLQAAADV